MRSPDVVVAALLGVSATVLHLVIASRWRRAGADPALFGVDGARVLRHMAVRGPMLDRGQFHPSTGSGGAGT